MSLVCSAPSLFLASSFSRIRSVRFSVFPGSFRLLQITRAFHGAGPSITLLSFYIWSRACTCNLDPSPKTLAFLQSQAARSDTEQHLTTLEQNLGLIDFHPLFTTNPKDLNFIIAFRSHTTHQTLESSQAGLLRQSTAVPHSLGPRSTQVRVGQPNGWRPTLEAARAIDGTIWQWQPRNRSV